MNVLNGEMKGIISDINNLKGYKTAGEEKKAIYYKRAKELKYWNSRNTEVFVQCDSLQKAKKIIENSKIEQKLIIKAGHKDLAQEYFDKVAKYITLKDISSPYISTLQSGDSGLGFKVDGKEVKLSKDEAMNLTLQLNAMIKRLK